MSINPILDYSIATGLHAGFDTYLYVEPHDGPHEITPGQEIAREPGDFLVVWVENPREAWQDSDDTLGVPVRLHKEYHAVPADNPILRLSDSRLVPLLPGRDEGSLVVGKSGGDTTYAGYRLASGLLHEALNNDSPVEITVEGLDRTSTLRSLRTQEVRWAADLSPLRVPTAQVASLRERLSESGAALEAVRARLAQAHQNHAADIAHIGDTFWNEAERRGWCSEADEVIRRMNAGLRVEIALREIDYNLTVVVSGTTTVTMEASGLSTEVEVEWVIDTVVTVTTTADPDDGLIEWVDIDELIQDAHYSTVSMTVEDVDVTSERALWDAVREEMNDDDWEVQEGGYEEV